MRAIIVEDEKIVGKWMKSALEKTGRVIVDSLVHNPLEALNIIEEKSPDVVFLDIEMPGCSGLEVAQKISESKSPPYVVFVTAYNEYAIEAFKVDALDYLLKPVEPEEIQRVLKKIEKKEKRVFREKKKVRIWTLGRFAIELSDEKEVKWPTAKCEELFAYMLLKAKNRVDKWELIELLWPGKDENKGQTNLRTTVYRLNQTMREHGLDWRVKSEKGDYLLCIDDFTLDLEALNHLTREKQEQMLALEDKEIIDGFTALYGGELFEGKGYLWAMEQSSFYERSFIEWGVGLVDQLMLLKRSPQLILNLIYLLLNDALYHEKLLIKGMDLIFELEGKQGLSHYYDGIRYRVRKAYDMDLSDELVDYYRELMEK